MVAKRAPVLALVAAAILFGSAYPVAQRAFTDIPPLSFVAWRFLIAAVLLLALTFPTQTRIWRDGAIGGLLLFAGYGLQAVGLDRTSVVDTALFSGLHVVIAPLLVASVHRSRPSPWVVVAVVTSFIGVILATLDETFGPESGDVVVLLAALAFAGNIAHLATVASRHLLVPLIGIQYLVTALLAFAVALPTDGPALPTGPALAPVLFTGVAVAAGAYLMQLWAHTRLGAERTAAGLTLVPAMGLFGGVLMTGERLAVQAWIGAALIIGAVAIVMARNHDLDTVTAQAVGAGH
jgi:drug/metabolite transporter (DMT)-like permease